ncbi:MAG: hypothetical protein ACLUVG_13475 [Phocaeicola vulgatus]
MSVSGTQISNDKLVSASSDSQAGVISDALLYPKYLSIFDDEGKYLINPDHPNPMPIRYHGKKLRMKQ